MDTVVDRVDTVVDIEQVITNSDVGAERIFVAIGDPVAVVLDAEADGEPLGVFDDVTTELHRRRVGVGTVSQPDGDNGIFRKLDFAREAHLASDRACTPEGSTGN